MSFNEQTRVELWRLLMNATSADTSPTPFGADDSCSVLREIQYELGPDGKPQVTGLLMGNVGRQQVVTADAYVAALDVPGAQRLMPQAWRRFPEFDNIYKLVGVPVITVQLR